MRYFLPNSLFIGRRVAEGRKQVSNFRGFTSKTPPKDVESRGKFKYWLDIQTRWKDNDMYGHVNNAEYYSYFDTVINHFLIHRAGLNPKASKTIGLCVESKCNYFRPIEFPDIVEAGLLVSHKGKTSVKYEVGIFTKGSNLPVAHGHFVHVFVDEKTRKPTPFSEEMAQSIDAIYSQ